MTHQEIQELTSSLQNLRSHLASIKIQTGRLEAQLDRYAKELNLRPEVSFQMGEFVSTFLDYLDTLPKETMVEETAGGWARRFSRHAGRDDFISDVMMGKVLKHLIRSRDTRFVSKKSCGYRYYVFFQQDSQTDKQIEEAG